MPPEFVHLHLHTDYSMLDGASDVEKLVARVKELGQPAVAMTDHGNIYGAVHFQNAAKEKGVKAILGCELYICQKENHREAPEGDKYNHLIVLAENEEGYRNLVKIVSEASLHGFYYKPRVSKNFLAEHSKGLIGLSACLKGEVAERLTEGKYEAAKKAATTFGDIFGANNFYLEIQDQGLEEEKRIHQGLFDLEKDLGYPMVATNDSHYLCEDDSHAQDVMVCIQTGKSIHDTNRMKFSTNQFFVKSAHEMSQVFTGADRVLARTMEIAERCNVKLEKVKNPFPRFDVPEGMSIDSYFEDVARRGMAKRMNLMRDLQSAGRLRHTFAEYEERLNFEIDTIKKMQFPGYFLIVWDFIRYARENNIPVGPGRGSAAGSLVAYAMTITDVDPLQNNLLFQRFLNPERISMPDIDVDFCMNRRGEVIKYVTEKYGRDQVAQIITFGTMAAKAAIKDCGRAMDIPYAEVDRVAKMVPTTINITIDGALKDSPMLATAYESEPQVKELIDTAKRLEGLVRNSGVHASAVVIAPQPLTDLVPLHKTKNDEIVTAYDMKAVEKMGLLKMDFLGLTTLTILDDALKLIDQTQGVKIELEKLPFDDKQTYERIFHSGYTSGVFQFESSGMRDVLRKYKPDTVEDLTALNALYRPGPIQGGMIDDFINRKWGRAKVDYFHDDLKTILVETLGVIVYQEQVMQIANKLAGYSLGDADLLRRAMGKKDAKEMEKQRDRFTKGAIDRGYDKQLTVHIFDLMEQFAGYGFNKSHSAAYALLAYHTAYLKTHFPIEFMAALLTSVSGSTDDVVKYINECRDMGIEVRPPDVNVSLASFTPDQGAIRFGLSAIKNLGHNAIESIVTARQAIGKFSSFFEFCEKVDLRLLNKRVVESLIKSGAMDPLGRRSQLFAVIDKAMEAAQKTQRDAESGQHGLFGVFDEEPVAGKKVDSLPNVPDWDEHQRLANEKEILGFFITGHPMEKYKDKLADFRAMSTEDLKNMRTSTAKGEEYYVGGVMSGVKVAKSKKGDMYALGTLEDIHGAVSFLCFNENYKRLVDKLKLEVPVLVKGAIRIEEDNPPKIMVSDIIPLDTAVPKLPQKVRVRVPLNSSTEGTLDALHGIFGECKGTAKVLFDLEMPGDFLVVMEAESYNVQADRAFVARVEELCGRGAVRAID
ncbi:DNA polymerase III, alpha subunit [Candidatus Koribacter versatilis Ellin345]|uniref:DNA polymerase III subunit alpha n=1 Tax=Koribacter versatilis (strain Ellin345) TaxID=204669 RepID=Q1IN02_KORVE|nr:DNA polymerase III subunit alpha [Candidatus Koribacter versatilis]ABF41748.1 DNA polymerase III, alpha subunit [Candidatus Koribacter versatilis Ellin345]